jgi:ornithine cyclodeaminase
MNGARDRIDEMIERRCTLILTESDVRQVLDMRACIDQQELAYKAFSAGEAIVPQRLRIPIPEHDGNSSAMPGYVPSVGGLGCKIVSGFHQNRDRGLPSTLGSLVLLDHVTGFPLAYMGSTFLTNARTGAGGGAAARALMRNDARTVGVLGSGALARTTLDAVRHVMQIDSVIVYSRTPANRKRYATEMRQRLGLAVQPAADAAAPAAADLVVLATTSQTPVLDGTSLQPGTTVISVGTNRPTLAEFPASAIKGNKFIGDSRQSIREEVGEFIMPMQRGELTEADIYGEIGQILNGELPGRENHEEIIVFKSTGLAVQDIITAQAVYHAALERGIGHRIAIQDQG